MALCQSRCSEANQICRLTAIRRNSVWSIRACRVRQCSSTVERRTGRGSLLPFRHTAERLGICHAAISQPYGPGTIRDIPIFPLSIVAFPTGDVPLNIFEARYRVLFNTLLAGAEGIEEDLVNYQKPWRGSRLFGMCYLYEGGMASIGTTLHIAKHERLPDGRLFIVSRGVEKFKVLKVLEERPVMICQVQMLEDSDDTTQVVQELADHDIRLFKDLIMLNVKMHRLLTSQADLDKKFDHMTPREISYWLGNVFSQNPPVQQALLEEASLEKRLIQERDILEASTRFLRAKVALQGAFTSDAKDEESTDNSAVPDESAGKPVEKQSPASNTETKAESRESPEEGVDKKD